ncbi:hypothetical protein N7474_008356 [Penicillium riverlandense]|uniref:uncharacterized protein n=1 Tax=Penicillium riverlandense TaxID=1903569 RepID=UPI0025492C2F|nr:uncharacterized protein N7474_008356 [Penicillium riverlandense]KAJ5812055.1 hypothetical protein N7474_008356 [Penicillium riverlandense]
MLNWEKVSVPISVYTADVEGNRPLAYSRVERPKLMKSKTIGKYVIWAHWELANSYRASEVIVTTADEVKGPYTITSKGHHRPGSKNQATTAMGVRVGGLRLDFSTSAKSSSDKTHPYMPNLPVYPPTIVQYNAPATESPHSPAYVPASEYGTATFSNIRFNVTLKAIAVVMTPWDASLYNQYASQYSVSQSTYIVQYPTDEQSPVTRRDFTIGIPSNSSTDQAPLSMARL